MRRLPVSCHFTLLSLPRPTGGVLLTHTGPPIMVSLANTDVSFSCRIEDSTGLFLPVYFFHTDIHGRRRWEKQINCHHRPGTENYTMDCMVKLSLPNTSATGTYYCIVKGQETYQSDGVFILVRGKAASQILPGRRKCKLTSSFAASSSSFTNRTEVPPRKPHPSGVPGTPSLC